jgi:fructokinase
MAPILVIGEALIDRLESGPVAGGAPFNVARSLAALGLPVRLITRIGTQDEDAKRVMASARSRGLDVSGIQRDPLHATGAVTVHTNGATHSFEIHENAAWDYLDTDAALAAVPVPNPEIVYFGTLAQRHIEARHAIRAVLKGTTALRYLDLNLRPPFTTRALVVESLELANWLKVSDDELSTLLAWFVPHHKVGLSARPSSLQPAVVELMRQFSLQRLVLTLGARGWATFDDKGHCDHSGPAEELSQVVDTVGAGDAFSAMLLATVAQDVRLNKALPLASGYAAAMCGQRGPMAEDDSFFAPWRQRLQALVLQETA